MNLRARLNGRRFCTLLLLTFPLIVSTVWGQSSETTSSNAGAEPSHLRLLDRLDRPQDGYCIDVLGTAGYLRFDLPLFAHNCKPQLTSDSAVVIDAEGRIRFAALNLCITVAGVNSAALPGAAVLLRECGEASPFFEAKQLQRFVLSDNGQLMLSESDLCLAVGSASAATYSTADRWRSLFVDDCHTVEVSRSRWEFVIPANQTGH